MVNFESQIWLNLGNEAKREAISRSRSAVLEITWCHRLRHPCNKGSTGFQRTAYHHLALTDTNTISQKQFNQEPVWSDLRALWGFGLSQGETEVFHACLLFTAHSFLNSILWSWFLNLQVGELMVFNFLKEKLSVLSWFLVVIIKELSTDFSSAGQWLSTLKTNVFTVMK